MNRAAFDTMFEPYWKSLENRFSNNSPIEYSPVSGNQRRVEMITANEIRLRETTARNHPAKASKTELREDLWKLHSDPRTPTDGVRLLRSRHGIKNLAEFKRAMFDEFAAFREIAPVIGAHVPAPCTRRATMKGQLDCELSTLA